MVEPRACLRGAAWASRLLESSVPRPRRPKRRLEQYRTPAELAVSIMWRLILSSSPPGIVYDLGCGTGMLAYTAACLLLGYAVGVDVDAGVLLEARSSKLYTLLPNIDFVQGDVEHPPLRPARGLAVTNPPFGIYSRRGIDLAFVEAGCRLTGWVISMHDAHSSRLLELASRRCRGACRSLGVVEFPIPAMHPTHRKKLHYIRVAIIECRREG